MIQECCTAQVREKWGSENGMKIYCGFRGVYYLEMKRPKMNLPENRGQANSCDHCQFLAMVI